MSDLCFLFFHCLWGLGWAVRTQIPEQQNRPIKGQFTRGSKRLTEHITSMRNEMRVKEFKLLATDMKYGPVTDSILFNDPDKFFQHMQISSKIVPASIIHHNIMFRNHIQRIAHDFDRLYKIFI